jgi:hypothetical protein
VIEVHHAARIAELEAQLDEARALLALYRPHVEHVATAVCWKRDWMPLSEDCGECLHCLARAALAKEIR